MPEQIIQETGASILLLQQLQTIQTTVTDIERKQDVQNVKLFGEESGPENSQGRLPRLEAKTEQHDKRIDKLEENWVKVSIYITAINSVISILITAVIKHFWK